MKYDVNGLKRREVKLGDVVGSVRILQLIKECPSDTRKTVFLVEHACCGLESEMVFGTLRRRVIEGVIHCSLCASRLREGEEKRAIHSLKNQVDSAFGLMNSALQRR